MSDDVRITEERNYKAFISYRHRPLDIEYAKKLHRRIERYVIPADLRVNGEKRLGLVFRDQDELPISDNLTESIRTALDHSEFLIVICSPDTPGSLWVLREISYFLEHHDRNHLLAMLISGTPETSFPPQLTEIRDADGTLLDQVEPLAANIVAESSGQRSRLFQTESLRILASLIGCPYDHLFHREQRYRMRRLAIGASAVGLVASAFIGLLLNRNARIREQLQVSMIQESQALAALSQTDFRDGDYRGALENALDALPGRTPGRPYVPAAEKALSDALYLYPDFKDLRYTQSFEQDTEITAVALDRDGSKIATGDRYGVIRVSDMATGQLLWEARTAENVQYLCFVEGGVLAGDLILHPSYFSEQGECLWETGEEKILDVLEDRGQFLTGSDEEDGLHVRLREVGSFRLLQETEVIGDPYYMIDRGVLSRDGRYAAVLARQPSDDGAGLFLFDLGQGERKPLEEEMFFKDIMASYHLKFDEQGNLVLVLCGDDSLLAESGDWKGSYITFFERSSGWTRRFTQALDFGTAARDHTSSLDLSDYLDLLESCEDGILLASRNRMCLVDPVDGKIRWQTDLSGRVKAGSVYSGRGVFALILQDGTVTLGSTGSGSLTSDFGWAALDCEFDIRRGALSGDSLDTARMVVVPDRDRSRASAIAFCRDTDMEAPAWQDQVPESAYFFTSPLGTTTVIAPQSPETGRGMVYAVFAEGDGTPSVTPVPDEVMDSLWKGLDHVFLTETGKLIMNGAIIDLQEQSVTGLTRDGRIPERRVHFPYASCWSPEEKVLLTASVEENADGSCELVLWRDAEYEGSSVIPAELAEAGPYTYREVCCSAVSPAGYAVVKTETLDEYRYALYDRGADTWSELPYMRSDTEETLALAQQHPWIALQKGGEQLVLIDLTSGEEILRPEDMLPGDSISRLIFAGEDEWLLAFTDDGTLSVYDTRDGRLLHRSRHSGTNLRFHGDGQSRYDVRLIPEQDRMLVLYRDTYYEEGAGILIDTGSFEQTGFFAGIEAYFPGENKVLVSHYAERPVLCRLYTLEELQKKAEALLTPESGEEEGE